MMCSVSTVRFLVICSLIMAVQFKVVAVEVPGFGFEIMLIHLEAFESRLNERLELLSQKVDTVKAEAIQMASISKLEDQLKEIRKENSANFERVARSISTLDKKVKVFENTNTNAFTNLRGNITLLSSKLGTSVKDLSDSGKELSKHLEQQMEQLTSYSGVYSMLYPGHSVGFHMYREGLQSHGYGGGWIVFQRRFDGSVGFNRSWEEYDDGFGDLRGEHCLGLRKLRKIVTTERHELLIELEDFLGQLQYAKYDNFLVANVSEGFQLKSLGSYSGTAGDSLSPHLGKVFATFDKNDAHNCARSFGGGWWFDECYHANLNGRYRHRGERHNSGVSWNAIRKDYSLKSSKMMVRPYSKRV